MMATEFEPHWYKGLQPASTQVESQPQQPQQPQQPPVPPSGDATDAALLSVTDQMEKTSLEAAAESATAATAEAPAALENEDEPVLEELHEDDLSSITSGMGAASISTDAETHGKRSQVIKCVVTP